MTPRHSPMFESLARDDHVLRKFVELTTSDGNLRNSEGQITGFPMSMWDLATKIGVGESKVAITMKWAVEKGFADRHKGLVGGQDAWTPTPRAIAEWPPPGAREQLPEDTAINATAEEIDEPLPALESGQKIVMLDHPTDPRFLLVSELPERVTMEDLACQRYGKPLTVAPMGVAVVYEQPGGPGTDWIRP